MKKLILFIGLFMFSTVLFSQNIIGHWPLNCKAYDVIGGNNGIINGALEASDRFGNTASAYEFKGEEDGDDENHIRVNAGNNNYITEFTISFWANWDKANDDAQMPFGNQLTDGTTKGVIYFHEGDFKINFDGDVHHYTDNNALIEDEWALYTVTYDGTTVRLYVNETLVTSANRSYKLYNNYTFGWGGYTTTNYEFNGIIDDVRIYDWAIKEHDISALYDDCSFDTLGVVINSISQAQSDFSFNPYPNPARKFLNVNYQIAQNSIADLSIISSCGKTVRNEGLDVNSTLQTINIMDLAPGIYVLQVTINNKTKYSKKIIIQ